MSKMAMKEKWMVEKYQGEPKPNEDKPKPEKSETVREPETIQQLAKRLAKASVKRRRMKIDIPIHGRVSMDEDELNAIRVNPKFTEYQKINEAEIEVDKEIPNTKQMWAEREKVQKQKEEVSARTKIHIKFENAKRSTTRQTHIWEFKIR